MELLTPCMSSKSDKLTLLQETYAHCEKCPVLAKNRTNVVFGVGNPKQCKVVIIGEAPGQQEDLQNEPFVGKSGQLLNGFLEGIGLSRADVYITNTILCRPPQNRNPSMDELRNCKARLDSHIEILDPQVIVTLGNFASQYMLQTKMGITKLRGEMHEMFGRKIIPMQHPAVLLYHGNSPAKRKEFEDDFELLRKTLESKQEEKQQKLF